MNNSWKRKKKEKRRLYIELLLLLALVAGCGGSGYLHYEAGNNIVPLEFKGGSIEIDIDMPEGDENFLFVIYNGKTKGDEGLTSISIDGREPHQPLLRTPSRKVDEKSQQDYHQNLLNAGARLLKQGLRPVGRAAGRTSQDHTPPIKQFRLLTSFNNLNSYETVDAQLIAASAQSAFYADIRGDCGWYHDSQLQPAIAELQQMFDEMIVPNNRMLFGDLPTVDDPAPIYILISPALHALGAIYNGILRGFFYSGDLIEEDDGQNAASNKTKIFYVASPDPTEYPSGTSMNQVIQATVGKIMPGTLAHELQHMINFNVRKLQNDDDPEEVWLNEGLAHLAEDANGFGPSNDQRALYYLLRPHLTSLTSGQDSLAQRGGNYLLLRHLINKAGLEMSTITRDLVSHNKTGTKKFDDIFGEKYEDLLGNFSLALWFDSSNLPHDNAFNIGPLPLLNTAVSSDDLGERLDNFYAPTIQSMTSIILPTEPTEINYLYLAANGRNQINIKIADLEKTDPGGYLIRLPDGDDGRLLGD